MNDPSARFQAPNGEALLRQIERMEAGRDMYLQLLRENPEIIKFQDQRTLENFGIRQHHGRLRSAISGMRAAWRSSTELFPALAHMFRLLGK